MSFLRKIDKELKALKGSYSEDELEAISKHGTIIDLPPGKVLFPEGQAGTESAIILSGQAKLSTNGANISLLEPGAVVGEAAILTGEPRTTTVSSVSMLKVSVLNAGALLSVIEESPDFRSRIGVTIEADAA